MKSTKSRDVRGINGIMEADYTNTTMESNDFRDGDHLSRPA